MKSASGVKRGLVELGIVILGVATALAADGWREALSDARLEADYLVRLTRDLQVDSSSVTALLTRMSEAQGAALELASLLDSSEEPSVAEVVRLAVLSTRHGFTREELVRDATFRELTMTGRLALIRDPTIRAAIVEHYRRAEVSARELGELPPGAMDRLWRSTGHRAVVHVRRGDLMTPADSLRLFSAFAYDESAAADLRELHAGLALNTERLHFWLQPLNELLVLVGGAPVN